MDPALVVGPYGATVLLMIIAWQLYKDNKAKDDTIEELRQESMALLKKYQDRDEEERQWRLAQDRKRLEGGA